MEKRESLLKLARLKRKWTPEFVSEQLGVKVNTYKRWEAGDARPRDPSLFALCKMFEMTPEELGLLDMTQVNDFIAMKRELYPDPLEEAIDEHQIEQNDLRPKLRMWTTGIAGCWEMYMTGKQTELEIKVPDYLEKFNKPSLTPGPHQKLVANLTTQAYQLNALLELQRGDFIAAQANCTQALAYSQLAKDWNLYIASQLRLASIFSARKRLGPALAAYNDALRRINGELTDISPLLHSWLFAGLGEIQAAMGREKEALQFLQIALTVFPAKPEEDPCFSYVRCDLTTIYLYEGLVFLRLGQPRLAWAAFSRIDELKPPPSERVRAEFLKHKAYTSLVLGNMTQTCIYLEAAVKAAQEISSDLAFSEAYTLYEHVLAIWGQEVRVRGLAKLFQR
jgi:transcriptional regulator with XRE-family HTH domain